MIRFHSVIAMHFKWNCELFNVSLIINEVSNYRAILYIEGSLAFAIDEQFAVLTKEPLAKLKLADL